MRSVTGVLLQQIIRVAEQQDKKACSVFPGEDAFPYLKYCLQISSQFLFVIHLSSMDLHCICCFIAYDYLYPSLGGKIKIIRSCQSHSFEQVGEKMKHSIKETYGGM